MVHRSAIIKALLALAVVWLLVAGIRAWADSRRATAESTAKTIATAHFSDWSDNLSADPHEAARREKELRHIADMVNLLDFEEREKYRDAHTLESLYRQLNNSERRLFVDLTIRDSMNQFMAAFDAMPLKERRQFVRQGLHEIERGHPAGTMKLVKDLDDTLIDRIASEGMRAYFEKADTNTILSLAPLMESMNEAMKGLRGMEHGTPGS